MHYLQAWANSPGTRFAKAYMKAAWDKAVLVSYHLSRFLYYTGHGGCGCVSCAVMPMMMCQPCHRVEVECGPSDVRLVGSFGEGDTSH
jgi:hypothetical protein